MPNKPAKNNIIDIPGLKTKDRIINNLCENANEINAVAVCYMIEKDNGNHICTSEYSADMDTFAAIGNIDHAIYMLNVLKHRLLTGD